MQMEFVKVENRVKCSTNLAVVVICFEMERAMIFCKMVSLWVFDKMRYLILFQTSLFANYCLFVQAL